MDAIVIILIDCAADRRTAEANAERLRDEVAERAHIVVVRRRGLAPLARTDTAGEGDTRGVCLGRALEVSSTQNADAVIITDTDTSVAQGWFVAASNAFADGAQLIAGPVRPNVGARRVTSSRTAGFALDYARHVDAPYLNASGHPSANNFGARKKLFDLMRNDDVGETAMWKTAFCAWAHDAGVVTVPVPAMAVVSTKQYRAAEIILDQFARGRLHSSIRSRTMSRTRRAIRVLASPMVPFVSVVRLVRRCDWQPTPSAWPLVFSGLCAWASGEAAGYIHTRFETSKCGTFG